MGKVLFALGSDFDIRLVGQRIVQLRKFREQIVDMTDAYWQPSIQDDQGAESISA
jgi:hypothetical protein